MGSKIYTQNHIWQATGRETTQQTRHIDPMMVQCWSTVHDVGPPLDQYWVDMLHLLGTQSGLILPAWSALLLCKAKRPYLLTYKVSRYGLSALHGRLS